MTVGATLVFAVLCLPLIGGFKGWGIGPLSRYLSAASSFAMALAVIWLGLSLKYRVDVRYGVVLWAFVPVSFVLIFVDGHRSVWLACAVVLLTLVMIGELRIERAWSWGVALSLAAIAALLAAQAVGLDPLRYFTSRAGAFVDPYGDRTSAWRAYVWRAQLVASWRTPLVGQGLGGYWSVYVPELNGTVTASPHSMYVQTLVKLGAVGLGLHRAVALGVFTTLKRALGRFDQLCGADRVLVVMAVAVVPASLAFQSVYAVEMGSMIWLGLGLAALAGRPERAAE